MGFKNFDFFWFGERCRKKEKEKRKRERKMEKVSEWNDLYVDHLLTTFSHLVGFYREILGIDTASLQVVDAGEMGILLVEGLCALVSLVVVEVFLIYFLFHFSFTLLKSKRFLFISFSYLSFIFVCFLGCTSATREVFLHKYLNVNATWIPELVDTDLVSLHSFEELFSLLAEASSSTWETSKLWAVCVLVVLAPIVRVTIYLLVIFFPFVKFLLEKAVKEFLAQDSTNIILEVSSVVFLVLSWLLKRHIERARFVPFLFHFLQRFFLLEFFSWYGRRIRKRNFISSFLLTLFLSLSLSSLQIHWANTSVVQSQVPIASLVDPSKVLLLGHSLPTHSPLSPRPHFRLLPPWHLRVHLTRLASCVLCVVVSPQTQCGRTSIQRSDFHRTVYDVLDHTLCPSLRVHATHDLSFYGHDLGVGTL